MSSYGAPTFMEIQYWQWSPQLAIQLSTILAAGSRNFVESLIPIVLYVLLLPTVAGKGDIPTFMNT